jgi:hypothetical protein
MKKLAKQTKSGKRTRCPVCERLRPQGDVIHGRCEACLYLEELREEVDAFEEEIGSKDGAMDPKVQAALGEALGVLRNWKEHKEWEDYCANDPGVVVS